MGDGSQMPIFFLGTAWNVQINTEKSCLSLPFLGMWWQSTLNVFLNVIFLVGNEWNFQICIGVMCTNLLPKWYFWTIDQLTLPPLGMGWLFFADLHISCNTQQNIFGTRSLNIHLYGSAGLAHITWLCRSGHFI